MKNPSKLLPLSIFFFGIFIFNSAVIAQNTEIPYEQQTFHQKLESTQSWWDEQIELYGGIEALSEINNEYKHFRRYKEHYKFRVEEGESVDDYYQYLKEFVENPFPEFDDDLEWSEIGPNYGNDIGPVNFLSKDPNNPDMVLAGAEFGGLFYTLNATTSCDWQNGGTDHLVPDISSADAVISPYDSDTWFFIDGNGEFEIRRSYESDFRIMYPTTSVHTAKTTGIYRTTDAGVTWECIGDRERLYDMLKSADFNEENNNKWTMKKILIDPTSTEENLNLYLATSIGLIRTTNALANADDVDWDKVYSIEDAPNELIENVDPSVNSNKQLWIYKIIWMPNPNPDIDGLFIATASKTMRNPDVEANDLNLGTSLFTDASIIYSETGDEGSWLEWTVPVPFQNDNVFGVNALRIDLATTPANPSMLYALTHTMASNNDAYLGYSDVIRADISSLPLNIEDNDWEVIAQNNTSDWSTKGFIYSAIAVDPNDETRIFYTRDRHISEIEFTGGSWSEKYYNYYKHMDHEDLLFFDDSDLFIANHGGVLEVPSGEDYNGAEWKNSGLGIAQVTAFATSFSNPETILLGLWHDHSQITTNVEYDENWVPMWDTNVNGGDAFDPDINYSNNKMIYTENSNSTAPRAYYDYPSLPETQHPVQQGTNGNFSHYSGTSINYFNHNTIYTNWFIKDSNPENYHSWVYRHSDKGGGYNDPDWRIIFNMRDDVGTHPLISDFITERLQLGVNDVSIKSQIVFHSKADKNLIFSHFNIGSITQLAISNKAQYGISGNLNNESNYIVDEVNNSWVMIDNYDEVTNSELFFNNIHEIESDPLNPNIFYMETDGRLKKCSYSGDIMEGEINPNNFVIENIPFENISTGNRITINSIYILPGTADFFIGTDIGVYISNTSLFNSYLNDEIDSDELWEWYGENLPYVEVREIEPNFVADKLRCGTFGRGAWEIDLPCDKLTNDGGYNIDFIVPGDTHLVINNYARFRQDVVVQSGATLTLKSDAKVYFAEHCGIIVEPGGHLIVDGALLSNACGDALWLGISVEGDAYSDQLPHENQGKVTIKNGAVIENAHTGVWLRANTDDCEEILGTGGGIVFATNSTFKNCYVGIEFSKYRRNDWGNPISNISYIRQCHFLTTRTLNGGFDAKAGISLKELNKLKISGNTFENTITTINDHPIYTGIGIISANSTFEAKSWCTSETYPCTGTYTENRFINLIKGVKAYAWDMDNTFSIENAIFEKCAYGISAKKVHYASVTKCDFDVSPDPTTVGSLQWTPYGMHFLGCGSYQIEENDFYSDDSSYERVGIVVQHSYNISNQIYKNKFDNLYTGTIAQGDNQVENEFGNPTEQGLEILCGVYGEDSGNEYDIAFTNVSKVATHGSQYTEIVNDEVILPYSPANNFYSNNSICNDANAIHVNEDSYGFIYFYKTGEFNNFDNTSCWTSEGDINIIGPANIFGDDAYDYNNSCPTHLSSFGEVVGAEEILSKETIVEETRIEIINLKNEITNIENGGQDEQTLIDIINNVNNSSTQVRNTLYQLSPNLNDNVLLALLHRTPEMDNWALTELLIANSPLRFPVLNEYYQLMPLIPVFHNLLISYQDGETTLTSLERELKNKKVIKDKNQADYIRIMTLDMESLSDYSKIDELLAQDEDNQALKIKIALANSKDDYTAIQNYLDVYQPISDADAYVEFQEVLLEARQLPSELCELSLAQKSTLESIISNNKLQKYAAENILEYSDGQVFDELIVLPISGTKSMRVENEELVEEIALMDIHPNPADKEVFFTFKNNENISDAILEIFDAKMQLLKSVKLADHKGIYRLNLDDWTAGVYFGKLSIHGVMISEKTFTKMK